MATTLLKQAVIMLLLIGVGVLAYRTKLVNKEGGRQLSNLVLEIVTPVLVVTAYADVEYETRLVKNLLWTFLLAACSYLVVILAAYLFLRRRDGRETEIERFSAIYSNCGFMGIPLMRALFGTEGVFYATAFLTVFFCFSWTHGIILLTGQSDRKALIKKLTSPTIIGIVIGLLLFFFQIQLPEILDTTLGYISDLNTPLAMIAAGISVAGAGFLSALRQPRIYYVTALKLLILPAILLVLLLPMTFIPIEVRTAVLVLTAAPSASMCTLQCQKHGKNDGYAAQIFAVTTILSMATMPLIVQIFTLLT